MDEKFKDAGPCPIDGVEIQLESPDPGSQRHIGELWIGFRWIDVQQVRELRDWLNEILP